MKKTKLQKRIEKALSSLDDNKYWKWKLLPSPITLGMSNSNALGSKHFGSQTGQATWEDWEEKVKTLRPIRFFIAEELAPWIRSKYRIYITDPTYWVKCHFIPEYKYHLLDLRESKEDHMAYRYGWIDSDHKMVLALFTILNNFVKNEMPNLYCPSEEDVEADSSLMRQRGNWLEIKAIHYWYNIERKRQADIYNVLLDRWSTSRKGPDPNPETHQMWIELQKHEDRDKEKMEEMIARLLKIRGAMWT